ncbi:MAG: ParB-like protein [Tepidisphaeraceae bacterium]
MPPAKTPRLENVELSKLRPTQMTVGMLQVKSKRKQIRSLEKRPGELVQFILENPIRVVLGPADRAYVIDHHHLALALTREDFQTAPMQIQADFSALSLKPFWKRMQRRKFVHPINAHGRRKSLSDLPRNLNDLKDDPYRSLAGFVREAGGYGKVATPFAEFKWADFFRSRISKKLVRDDFDKALARAKALSKSKAAARLPGYIRRHAK